jgi:hypothetical protein
VQSTKSGLVKFCVFLHKSGASRVGRWLIVSSLESCRSRIRSSKRHFAISRFESWHPSQPPWSLPGDFSDFAKSRHFRRLVAKSSVSGLESRRLLTESLDSGDVSLLAGFSISEVCTREHPETGCVSAETGSNPAAALRASGALMSSSIGRGGNTGSQNRSRPPATTDLPKPVHCPAQRVRRSLMACGAELNLAPTL